MIISLIVAASTNNVIGKNNQLPWHLPNDLKFFKNTTWGMPLIMGRKTFQSLNKPLPGRINIIITRQQDWHMEGIIVAHSLEEALEKAKATNCKEVFIAGGGEIFNQSIALADKIYLTRVHATIEGNVFFPAIDKSKWKLIDNEDFEVDKTHTFAYSFQIWENQ
jgi:dihydrofolate reductase